MSSTSVLKSTPITKKIPVDSAHITQPSISKNTAAQKKSSGNKAVHPVIPWIIPTGILVLWLLATHLNWIKPYFVPAPESMYDRLIGMIKNERFLNDFWLSFHVMLIGWGLGVIFGVFTGISAGLSRAVDAAISPTIHVIRQVPAMAWVPLFILFLGISLPMKLLFLAKVVAIPVFLNTFQGIRTVNKEFLEVAEVFEYSKFKTLIKVILPAAFPSIFTGLRFSLGASWGAVVFVEMLNGRAGIGWVLGDAFELLDTSRGYVAIVIIGFVGLAFDILLGRLEKKLMRWKRQAI